MNLSFYKSPIFEEVRDEARTKGRAEGRAEGQAEDVLTVLTERGIDVPEDIRERITGCGDPETLSRWLRRAVTAASAAQIFEAE